MIAWMFQSMGILLGAHWAYAVLGWAVTGLGPGRECVFPAVADGHGVPAFRDDAGKARHDEGLERVAGVHHISALHPGTFLTRSGVVSSVHAFARSSIGAGSWDSFVDHSGVLGAYLKNRDY